MTELELAVADYKPHMLGISGVGHDLEDVQLEDYDIFLSNTIDNDNLGVSRVVCYLVGSLREDLMSDSFSSIWMEIGLPRKKKILYVSYTRSGSTLDRKIDHQEACQLN